MNTKAKLSLLKTWARFRQLRSYEWQCLPIFWRLKRWRALLAFQFKKRRFKARSLLRDSAETTSIFGQVIRVIFWRLIFSLALVFVFAVLDQRLRDWNPSWLSLALNREAQRDFLATLGQVAAAFLTLYFTAISVVVSTAYARAPGTIRSLIMREEVGSVYFGILAQFAGVVIVMLTALVFGYQLGPLNTLLASFLCLFSIFGFVFLGVRAFHYFDPAALVSLLNRRIWREVQSVTPEGYQWEDQSFQAHHQRQAAELLGNFSDLVTVASQKENLHGKGLVDVGQGLLLALNYYAKEKVRIPSSSYWFKRTYKHKNWLLTSHNELEVALVTGTVIQPDTVPDLMWFEAKAARILEEVCLQLGELRDSAGTIALTTSLQNHIGGMSQCLAVAEALQIFKAVVPTLRSQSGIEKITADEDASKATNRLAVSELYACGLINILLGFSNKLEKLSPDSIAQILRSVNWLKSETLYTARILPRRVIQEMESVRECFDFEIRVEGKITSPEWVQIEMVGLGCVRFLDEVTKALIVEFETTFGKEVETQLVAKNYVLVAQLVQRGLEGCSKASNCFAKLTTLHEGYAALNRSKEYEWPKIDWAAFQERFAALRVRLITALAKSSNELANLPESLFWPDFFGHAYTVLGEECFIAMAAGKEELFQVVFPAFFNLVLRANEKLRQKFLGDARNIRLSVDPLVDLMAVSGFAAVFAELDNKNFWKQAERCWNNYFDLYEDDKRKRQFIELLCAVVEPDWRITPRSVMRTRWQQMFGRVVHARGIFQVRAFWDDRRSAVNHHSLLVRVFCRSEHFFTEAHDVFLTLHIFKRPESAGVEKPHDVEYLERALQPETDDENDLSSENE
ncbi:MAG: hypothetical protein DME24_05660 [Verrucomicrobia bacterium]|nr:MAG: hypothetical protein DME24_05660 [Verrucomicrobiota bacterium]